jgi:hypothetical protein
MKNLKIFWLILSLTVLMFPSLESKPSGLASSFTLEKKDPCEEQKNVVEDLIKKINEQNTPAIGEAKSPLEQAEADVAEKQSWLDNDRCGKRHGTNVKEERREKENNLDKSRKEYGDRLALTEQLKAEIEKFKKTCQKALEDEDSNESLDLKEYNLFYEEQEGAYKKKREALVKAAGEEEFIRIMEEIHKWVEKEECPKYYLRLLKLLERKVGESERDYRRRLIGLQRRYPWLDPVAGTPNDEAAERNRRIKEKWDKDFWKKVKEAIKAKMKELEDNAAKEPQGNTPPPEEGSRGSENKNVLPWKDKNIYRTADFRSIFSIGLLAEQNATPFDLDQMDGLLKSIYEQPAIHQELAESLGGEFTLGTFSAAPVFTDATYHPGKQGGIMLTGEFLPHCEMGVRFTYSNALAKAHFPVTILDFSSTDPSPQTIQGDYTLQQKTMGLRTGGNYRFGNGSWQPLLGAWAGIAQQHETTTASIADVSWELGEETTTAFSYALVAALRWQSPGKLFLHLQGQWGQIGDNKNYGAALGLGLNFGR